MNVSQSISFQKIHDVHPAMKIDAELVKIRAAAVKLNVPIVMDLTRMQIFLSI
jgi:hypothetical protein